MTAKISEPPLEIEECLDRLLAYAKEKESEEVALSDACGRVLAEDVYSEISVPPYPKSAMDGYAVLATDTAGADREHPVKLTVKGELMAGDFAEIPYEKNTALRVMTGAYVPKGYDAVIRQEDTNYGEETVEIYTPAKPYTNYCKAGEDIASGTLVLPPNTRLTPLAVGLLAEIGRGKIAVRKPVAVSILCTGSELTDAGEALKPGKIYNNISYILETSLKREGFPVVFREICVDDEEILARKIKEALRVSDILITTGGVSVGKKDLLPAVLKKLGADILFHGANIQPGTPTMGSVLEDKIILSLSGNPYAAMVNFDLYFWALTAKMMGNDAFAPVRTTAVLRTPYPKKNHHRRFLRAWYENGEVTLPSAVHASSVIANLTECNCYIDLEPGREPKVGETVRIQLFK